MEISSKFSLPILRITITIARIDERLVNYEILGQQRTPPSSGGVETARRVGFNINNVTRQ